MPGKILPDNQIEQWVRAGKKNTEIVRLLEERYHITVTRQAISVWRNRHGDDMAPKPPKRMPWKVREEHRQTTAARAIRASLRQAAGETLPAEEALRLAHATEHLKRIAEEQGWRHGAVFHYDPEAVEGGWLVVERRAGVDTGIVRDPKA